MASDGVRKGSFEKKALGLSREMWRASAIFLAAVCGILGFLLAQRVHVSNFSPILQSQVDVIASAMGDSPAEPSPLVILITSTYPRPFQASYMMQLATTICIADGPILWFVIESVNKTAETKEILDKISEWCPCVGPAPAPPECEGRYKEIRHVASELPQGDPSLGRGIQQRNRALAEVEEQRIEGLVFFADDDNAYSPRVFQEIRKVKRIGIWPVGLLWSQEYGIQASANQNCSTEHKWKWLTHKTKVNVEHPWVAKVNGSWRVVGWHPQKTRHPRKYPMDMASFAFHSSIMWEETNSATGKPDKPLRFVRNPGCLETDFVERIIAGAWDLEPLANGCTEVHVWHKHMESERADKWPALWGVDQSSNKGTVDPTTVPGGGGTSGAAAEGEAEKI